MADLSPHQQKIVKRYYKNIDAIKQQRLADLVGEIYLSSGKKLDRAWDNVATALRQIEFPEARIEQLMKHRNPEMLAEVVNDLQR